MLKRPLIVALATVALMTPAFARATHDTGNDGRTNKRTWWTGANMTNNWDGALGNGATVWDNVLNQCHQFARVFSGGQVVVYKPDVSIDGQGGTFALTWGSHTGIAFDPGETWHLNVNTSPGASALDAWSEAAHEFGHVLSLAHASDPNATMVSGYDYGQTWKRSLETYDRTHEQALYPPGSC